MSNEKPSAVKQQDKSAAVNVSKQLREMFELCPRPQREALDQKELQKVFISLSNGKARAKTFVGVGATVEKAFEAALRRAEETDYVCSRLPKYVLFSVVAEEEKVSLEDFYQRLRATRRGYYRYGFSLDDDFETAFIEQEVYGASLVKYGNRDNQSLNKVNIERQIKYQTGNDIVVDIEAAAEITLFSTLCLFYERGTRVVLDNDIESLNYHMRAYPDPITEPFLRKSLEETGDFLASLVQPSGRFIYAIYPCFARESSDYNVMRGLGGTLALADLCDIIPKPIYREKAILSLEYAINNFVYEVGDLAFIKPADTEPSVTQGELKSGANGLAILAINRLLEITTQVEQSPAWRSLLTKLADGLLFMQNSDGSFNQVLNLSDLSLKDKFRIVFYDGEAVSGLAKVYSRTHDKKILNAIRLALDYAIDNQYDRYGDQLGHWQAYAVEEVMKYLHNDRYFKYGLRNLYHDLESVISRIRTDSTLLETLIASWAIVRRLGEMGRDELLFPYNLRAIPYAVDRRIRVQLSSIMQPELAMFYRNPDQIKGGIFIRGDASRMRVDDSQHHLLGFANYYRQMFFA